MMQIVKRVPLMAAFIFIAYYGGAQGIRFDTTHSWQEIKEKAAKEKMYILIDCYTTWCGPCKAMDQEVYNKDAVGDFFNRRFISVKVQMDKTKNDNARVKSWYADAKQIQGKYKVYAFPGFLVFDSQGQLVYRDVGYKTVAELIDFGKAASDPNGRLDDLLQKYRGGNHQPELLRALALSAKKLGNQALADSVAQAYKTRYLDKMHGKALADRERLSFIMEFNQFVNTGDPWFRFFYQHSAEADEILESKGLSTRFTDYVINKEEINRKIYRDGKPLPTIDWDALYTNIAKKYGKTKAETLILNGKIGWYEGKKDWTNAVKYHIEKIDKFGLDTAGLGKSGINNLVYNIIFKHSTDSVAINKGLEWMEYILKLNPDRYTWRDTYANLLYKAGRKTEAVEQEKLALEIISKKNAKSPDIALYRSVIEKIKRDEPTWIE